MRRKRVSHPAPAMRAASLPSWVITAIPERLAYGIFSAISASISSSSGVPYSAGTGPRATANSYRNTAAKAMPGKKVSWRRKEESQRKWQRITA